MPAYDVDGMDVMAVKQMVSERLAEIRSGKGPQFLEICTYRFRGHSMGDPEKYRSKEEVKKFEERGPIDNFSGFLTKNGIAEKNELDEIVQDVEREVEEAVRFAHESPEPADEALFEHIYAEEYGG